MPLYSTYEVSESQRLAVAIEDSEAKQEALKKVLNSTFSEVEGEELTEYVKEYLDGKITVGDLRNLPFDSVTLEHLQEYKTNTSQILFLKTEHKPYVEQEVRQLVLELGPKLDYSGFVDLLINNFDYEATFIYDSLSSIAFMQQVLYKIRKGFDFSDTDYDDLKYNFSVLKQLEEEWKDRHLTKELPNGNKITVVQLQDSAESERLKSEVIDEITSILQINKYWRALELVYKVFHTTPALQERNLLYFIQSLLNLEEGVISPRDIENYHNFGFNLQFITALKTGIQNIGTKFENEGVIPKVSAKVDEGVRNAGYEDTLKFPPVVIGLEPVENLRLVIDFPDVEESLKKVPYMLLGLLKEVRFIDERNSQTDILKDESAEGSLRIKIDETGHLVSAEMRIYKNVYAAKGSEAIVTELRRESVKQVIFHELGHLILEQLDYEDLMLLNASYSKPSTYYSSRLESTRIGRREDFCESFALFCQNPAYFKHLSPLKFSTMRRIIYKYSSDKQREELDKKLQGI